jgi:hypothetical protein
MNYSTAFHATQQVSMNQSQSHELGLHVLPTHCNLRHETQVAVFAEAHAGTSSSISWALLSANAA